MAVRAGWGALAFARARAARGLLVAVSAGAAVVTALVAGQIGAVFAAQTDAARAAFAAAPDSATSIAIDTRRDADPDAQAAQQRRATDALAGLLIGGTLPLTVIDDDPEYLRFIVEIDPATVTSLDVPVIDRVLRSSTAAIEDADAAVNGVGITSDADDVVALLQQQANVITAVVLVPQLLLGAVALAASWQLARLIALLRGADTALLRARGSGIRRLAWTAALESGVAGLAGALVGAVGLHLGLTLAGLPTSWFLEGAVAFGATVATAACGFVATRSSARATSGLTPVELTRRGGAVAVAPVALLIVAATFTTWQLLSVGSPIARTATGVEYVDPVVAVAPVLLTLGLVVLAGAALPVLASLAAVAAGRGRGTAWSLPARQVARRIGVARVPATLTAVAVAVAVLAATVVGTVPPLERQARLASVGADVVVDAGADRSFADLAALPGVTATAPVVIGDVDPGDGDARLVAIAADDLLATMRMPAGVDPETLATAIAATPSSPALDGSGGIAVTLTVTPEDRVALPPDAAAMPIMTFLGVDALLLGPDGDVRQVPLDGVEIRTPRDAPQPVTTTIEAAAPTEAGWRLLAVRVTQQHVLPGWFHVVLDGIGGVETPVPADGWSVAVSGDGAEPDADGAGFSYFVTGGEAVSASAQFAVGGGTPSAVVGAELAERLGLEPGDELDLRGPAIGTGSVEVAAIAPLIPGGGATGVLVDRVVLAEAVAAAGGDPIAATQWWLSAGAPGTVSDAVVASIAAAAAADAPAGTVHTADAGALGATVDAIRSAFLAGAAGALLLAAAGLAAAAVGQLRSRRGEVAVLAALGLPPTAIGASRRRELWLVGVFGLVVGAVAGGVVALVTAPVLARAAVTGAPSAVTLVVDPIVLALALVVAIGAATAATRAAGALVVRQARHGIREVG